MSGRDDFRTQYRDWGMGEQQERYYDPDPGEKAKILAYVYQHGAEKVQEWLDQAVLFVAKEEEAKKEKNNKKRSNAYKLSLKRETQPANVCKR